VARWVLAPVGTVIGASFVLYLGLSLAPGDPVKAALGGRGTPEEYAALRSQLGLDEPLLLRYVHWVGGALHGDLGMSVVYKAPVTDIVGPRMGITLGLIVMASVLIIGVGILMGCIGGGWPKASPGVAALGAAGIAIPAFVAAQVLIMVFGVRLGWLPVIGAGDGVRGRVQHLILPSVALAISWSAYVAQVTRVAVAEQRRKPYVEVAQGRGIAPVRVYWRHTLRGAAIPITTVSALAVAGLVAGSVVVEVAFGLGGVGSLLVQSIAARDFNVVLAISLVMLVVFVITTTFIDLIQILLDPRMR